MASNEQVERDIRWAYAQCIRNGTHRGQEPGDWVAIARLLDYVDYPKVEFDRAIVDLVRSDPQHYRLISEDNQKSLTAADRAAAVRLGGQDKHLLAIYP